MSNIRDRHGDSKCRKTTPHLKKNVKSFHQSIMSMENLSQPQTPPTSKIFLSR